MQRLTPHSYWHKRRERCNFCEEEEEGTRSFALLAPCLQPSVVAIVACGCLEGVQIWKSESISELSD